ncbi:MAG: hypothetical protein MHPSP_003822, partial [Paramarteilia canceri]
MVDFRDLCFVMLKPECFKRRLVGKMLIAIEDKGLNILQTKILGEPSELEMKIKKLYEEHCDKPFFD